MKQRNMFYLLQLFPFLHVPRRNTKRNQQSLAGYLPYPGYFLNIALRSFLNVYLALKRFANDVFLYVLHPSKNRELVLPMVCRSQGKSDQLSSSTSRSPALDRWAFWAFGDRR